MLNTLEDSDLSQRKTNEIGQPLRPRRLNDREVRDIVSVVEAAMNNGKDEVRVYWIQGTKHVMATTVAVGDKLKMGRSK